MAEVFFSRHPRGSITGVFKVSPSRYARFAARRIAGRLWWAVAVPVAVAIIAGLVLDDIRFLFLALILVFLVAPFIAAGSYLSLTLSRDVSLFSLPTKMAVTEDGDLVFHHEASQERRPETKIASGEIVQVSLRGGFWEILAAGRKIPVLVPATADKDENIAEAEQND